MNIKTQNMFATKKDLSDLRSATQKDLSNLRKEITDDLRKEIKSTQFYLDYKIEMYKKEIDKFKKEFIDFKDKALTNLDWLVGAFKKFEEEHMVLTGKYSTINVKLDNHESRIQVLEHKIPS